MESSGVGSKSIPQTISVPLTSDTGDGSKLEFLQLDQWVTKPACWICGSNVDSLGCSLLCTIAKLLAVAMLLTLCLQKKVTAKWKAWRGEVLYLYDTWDSNHCHINPTVGLLSSALSFLFRLFSPCRASTTFPHYFQFPQSSAFIFVLLTVQDTSVGKKAICIACLCTSGWIIHELAYCQLGSRSAEAVQCVEDRGCGASPECFGLFRGPVMLNEVEDEGSAL